MLKVKKLSPLAILPTVAHPGEDLGYDVYALGYTMLEPGVPTAVSTGIAASFTIQESGTNTVQGVQPRKFGLLVRDRSSMAAKGVKTSAGVIDSSYTGELKIMMTSTYFYQIEAGHKIAQILPTEVFTGAGIEEVEDLGETTRGNKGFGSTGV